MPLDDPIKLLKESRPFAILPGQQHAKLLEAYGKPTFDNPDNAVKKYVAETDSAWRRAVYHADIPANVPLGNTFKVTHTNIVLSFQYRTDTGTVWGVGVRDYPGIFRNTIGALGLSVNLAKAKELLGVPAASERFSPPMILEEVTWLSNELIYVCRFFTEPYVDPPVTYQTGSMQTLDVIASRHAPEAYVSHLLKNA